MVNFIGKYKKICGKDIIFYGFLTVYGGFLIFLSYKLNIWEDEAYSLNTTSNNLATVISQSYNFEGQPPVYFILLALWRKIDSGIFFARLFSLVFIGLSAIYFYRLVRFVSGFECSRWMLIIFLLNPFTIWAGLEIRLYSMVIFLSTISIYYFLRFYIENKNRYLYLFLLISLIGLYTQHFFVIEITALAFSSLVFKGWNIFFKLCIYLIPVIGLSIPNLFFISSEVEMMQLHQLEYSTLTRIGAVLYSPQKLMLGLEMVPIYIGINRGVRIIFILISVYAYFKLYTKQRIILNSYFRRINIIVVSLTITILLYCVLISVTGIAFEARYMAIVLPMFILIFTLFKVYNLIARSLIYIIISLYYISLLFLIYKQPIKRYDFKSAAKLLNRIEYRQEPILLYNKILLPPFTYYYTGPNPLISLPAFKFDNKYYEENIYDTSGLKQTIEKINSPTKSYLLMTGDIAGFKYPINMTQEMIDECLKTNYNVTLDTSLLGENKKYTLRIRRLEIKKTNNFP